MSTLQGRVAVITGSSRGIGRALALGLAAEGCNIVVAAKSVESSERLPGSIYTVAKEVEQLGAEALPVQVDVRDETQVEAMVTSTVQRFARIDILINNAGALWWRPLLDTPAKRFDLVMAVNARAAFLASRAVLPHMLGRRWGHIINNLFQFSLIVACAFVQLGTSLTHRVPTSVRKAQRSRTRLHGTR